MKKMLCALFISSLTCNTHETLKERDMIAKKMTSKQIEQAQELARKCTTNNLKVVRNWLGKGASI